RLDEFAALPEGVGLRQVFRQVKDGAVVDRVPLLDRADAEGDREMRLPDARRPKQEYPFCAMDEAAARQIQDLLFAHSRVEGKIKGVERLALGKTSRTEPPLE